MKTRKKLKEIETIDQLSDYLSENTVLNRLEAIDMAMHLAVIHYRYPNISKENVTQNTYDYMCSCVNFYKMSTRLEFIKFLSKQYTRWFLFRTNWERMMTRVVKDYDQIKWRFTQ